jgi:hypothetical protein
MRPSGRVRSPRWRGARLRCAYGSWVLGQHKTNHICGLEVAIEIHGGFDREPGSFQLAGVHRDGEAFPVSLFSDAQAARDLAIFILQTLDELDGIEWRRRKEKEEQAR